MPRKKAAPKPKTKRKSTRMTAEQKREAAKRRMREATAVQDHLMQTVRYYLSDPLYARASRRYNRALNVAYPIGGPQTKAKRKRK